MMYASFPITRAPCLPFMVDVLLNCHQFIDKFRWMLFGDSELLKELRKLRIESHLQKQAMNYLCVIARSNDEAFGRILTAQLSLYLGQGVPDPVRNHI